MLLLVKPKYKEYIISGAMLCYEEMNVFHEDVGFLGADGGQNSSKGHGKIVDMADMLQKEEAKTKKADSYAGWWYCCIPAEFVRKDNLPLPVFVRGDDVEYSLRNKAKFITLSGICIWHMGFTNKFNGAMEFYQVHRNTLMLQAASGVCQNVDIMTRIRKLIRVNLLRFNYDGAELLLDAVEDYMKGYKFFMKNQGEKLLKEKSQKNEKMEPLSKFPEAPTKVLSVYAQDLPRKSLETFLYRITYNGHFWPTKWLKKSVVPVAYDWYYSPHRNFFRRKRLAVNPYLKQGAYREMDKKRFFELFSRERKLFNRYARIHERLEKEYRDHRKEFTSESFWRKYLEIDK